MKSWKTFGFIALLVASMSGALYYYVQEQNTNPAYTVVRIIDGDTIEVAYENKTLSVRLLGIDAPEQNKCFSRESTLFLAGLILDTNVQLTSDPLNNNTDQYGRLLRYVYKEDVLINGELLKVGMARQYDHFPTTFDAQFTALEQQAKENNLGLWNEC